MNSNPESLTDLKLSIGLPIYNGEKFILKCLDSILAQTFSNFEIIISDNASTDDSVSFIEDHYPTVHIIKNQENGGSLSGTLSHTTNQKNYKISKIKFLE